MRGSPRVPRPSLRMRCLAVALLALGGASAAAAEVAPAPLAPVAPAIPPTDAEAAHAWAAPAATRLAARGLWPVPIRDLAAPAARRELARIAVGLAGGPPPAVAEPALADVAPGDPDGPALAEAVRRGWLVAPGGVVGPDGPVSAGEVDRVMVRLLGLDAERRGLAALATTDGRRFRLPTGFPSEVLVREAGLRHNYPARWDRYELDPPDVMSRADLAGMGAAAAELLATPGRRASLAVFRHVVLPALDPVEFERVQSAVAQVGSPYVWGGDWPTTASPEGAQDHGGFDCSGLAWFAFRAGQGQVEAGLSILPRATADLMAFAVPSERVGLRRLSGGDLLFFGDRGVRTRPGAISHVALVAGNGWLVQSSGSRDGVSLTRRATYWAGGEAQGRRYAEVAPLVPVPVGPIPAGAAANGE
jgi:NlpC/P60 family